MTRHAALYLFALTTTLAIAATSPGHAQAEGCNVRTRVPWAAGGEGFFAEAIVSGPSCAHAVVLFLARRPGGMPAEPRNGWPVLPGSAIELADIGPVADVPALASARDTAAMTAALPAWLVERVRTLVPAKRDNLAARRAAGETRGDCGARVTMPWPQAGAGYVIEVFADGTDCNNAAFALVVRAPDGKPLFSLAMSAFLYNAYHLFKPVTTSDEMKAALRQWVQVRGETTGRLPEWPAGKAEGEIVSGGPNALSYMIDTGKQFDRDSWNALRAAKRPSFSLKVSPETGVDIVLMPDGRVIQAAAIWNN